MGLCNYVHHLQVQLKKAMEIDGTSQRLSNLPTAWTLGSTCTGTGAFELVSDAVCNALNDALSDKTGTTFEAGLQ